MPAAVLLLHRLPDGTGHFDWMIQRAGGGMGAGLLTFRVRERFDGGGILRFGATRLGDHRAEYLGFEGEVSGGRGTVERVAEGELEIEEESAERVVLRGWIGAARGRFEGRAAGGADWEFVFKEDASGG